MTIRTQSDLNRAHRSARTQDRDRFMEKLLAAVLFTCAAGFGAYYLVMV